MRIKYQIFLYSLLFGFTAINCDAQNIHPYKMKFADFESWTPTQPGDVALKNFRPYRATYSRTYTSASTGQPVSDHIFMTAQEVSWYGKTVILFEYHDVGSLDFPDTNARTQFYYLDKENLALEMAVGPKAGTAQDYTTVRVFEDKITRSKINTETGEVEFSELANTEPVFPFSQLRFFIWGSMDLTVDDKILFNRIYNAPQNALMPVLGYVEEQTDYTTPDGNKYRPYVIDQTANPTSPIVNKFFVINQPPYVLAQGIYDADQDEITRWWLKLESFEYLDGK